MLILELPNVPAGITSSCELNLTENSC